MLKIYMSTVLGLFLNHYRFRDTFPRSLPYSLLQMIRYFIYQYAGDQLVLIVLEDFRADLIAIPITHTQIIVYFDFHTSLLKKSDLTRSHLKNRKIVRGQGRRGIVTGGIYLNILRITIQAGHGDGTIWHF